MQQIYQDVIKGILLRILVSGQNFILMNFVLAFTLSWMMNLLICPLPFFLDLLIKLRDSS